MLQHGPARSFILINASMPYRTPSATYSARKQLKWGSRGQCMLAAISYIRAEHGLREGLALWHRVLKALRCGYGFGVYALTCTELRATNFGACVYDSTGTPNFASVWAGEFRCSCRGLQVCDFCRCARIDICSDISQLRWLHATRT